MTERTYWLIMGAWTVVVLAMVGWMWWTIRKADKAHEVEEAFQNELLAEAEEYNRSHTKPILHLNTAEEWANYERESLGSDFQQRARRAESLGFIDPTDEPKRSA